MSWEVVLAAIAIAVSVVAIAAQVLFYRWQTQQGKKIGVVVMSTIDQIYRRLRAHMAATDDDDDAEDYAPEDILRADALPKSTKAGQDVSLRLKGYLSSSVMGRLEARCTVQEPLGGRAEVARNARLSEGSLGSFDLQVIYPREFGSGSTSEPGLYHIWWYLRDRWIVVEGDKRTPGSYEMGRIEDSFAVEP